MPSPFSEEQYTPQLVPRVFVVVTGVLCLLAACSSPKEIPKETETDSGPPPWPESDTKAVVDSMAQNMLYGPRSQWLQRWKKNHEGSPTLIIGPIENKTMQPVDENLVGKDLKKSIAEKTTLTDDSIQVLWDKELLCQIRRERASQCARFGLPEVAEWAKEKGADFIVYGEITSSGNISKDKYARRQGNRPLESLSYTVDLEMLNIEANVKAWLREKELATIVYWLESSPRSPGDSETCDSVAGGMRQC